MELISKEAVVQITKKYDTTVYDAAMWCRKEIEELKTYAGTEWHPYPQEKPNVDGEYNVTLKYSKCTTTANYYTEYDEWRRGGFDRCITAWAELPKPYEEGAEE